MKEWGSRFSLRGMTGCEGVVDGLVCKILVPDKPAPGLPWAWRPEFFDAFAGVDEAVVARGLHVVYLHMPDHYGSPKAMAHGEVLWREMTGKFGLSSKFAFIALSRGGLTAYNYAVRHPERVACIYADNPVCDFKSWPGGLGEGPGSATDWAKCLAVYGLTETEARAYAGNPVDRVDVIARARIPVFQVLGDADEVVPVAENGFRLRDRLLAAGGDYREIVKPGGLHHPHGLDDPTPVADFLVTACG